MSHEHHDCDGPDDGEENVSVVPPEGRLVPMPSGTTGGVLSTGGVKPTPFIFLGAGSGRSAVEVQVAVMAGVVGAVWVLL
jgi:hypothetical protein